MRAVVTVTGKDKKGIIAKVSTFLAERGVNVEDISQTLLQEYFAMIMLVDISGIKTELSVLAKECEKLGEEISQGKRLSGEKEGEEIGMSIRLQHEAIFNAMHNI